MRHGLTSGGAAREAGVSIEMIRHYERRRLVPQPPKPEGTGMRLYPRRGGLQACPVMEALASQPGGGCR